MLTKILLRIWPALLPWLIYFLWIFVLRKQFFKLQNWLKNKKSQDRIIEMEEKKNGESKTKSFVSSSEAVFYQKNSLLNNRHLLILSYLSLILAIISVISFAF
jgi:hypothetical protein